MKRGTIENPKVGRLADALGIPRYGAVGILEAIWHFSARNSPLGDIGKWSDKEIAHAAHWDGDPARLIESLVACRWLDKCNKHRLLVHDWEDHCERSVKKWVKENKLAIYKTHKVRTRGTPRAPVTGDGDGDEDGVESSKEGGVGETAPTVGGKPIKIPPRFDTPEVRQALCDWLDYKRHRGSPYKAVKFLEGIFDNHKSPESFCASVRTSMANNYLGIVPKDKPDDKRNQRRPAGPGVFYGDGPPDEVGLF